MTALKTIARIPAGIRNIISRINLAIALPIILAIAALIIIPATGIAQSQLTLNGLSTMSLESDLDLSNLEGLEDLEPNLRAELLESQDLRSELLGGELVSSDLLDSVDLLAKSRLLALQSLSHNLLLNGLHGLQTELRLSLLELDTLSTLRKDLGLASARSLESVLALDLDEELLGLNTKLEGLSSLNSLTLTGLVA